MLQTALLIIFLLSSCSQKERWQDTSVNIEVAGKSSKRLIYKVENPHSDVEIEFAKIDGLTTVFLNVHSGEIPPYEGDVKKAAIHIKTHDREVTLIADRLEGAQRLKLPPLASKHLIDALFSTDSITLSVAPHFKTSLDTSPFKAKYKSYKRGAPK